VGSGVLLRVESSVFGKPVSATSAESAGLLVDGASAGARDAKISRREFMVGGSKPESLLICLLQVEVWVFIVEDHARSRDVSLCCSDVRQGMHQMPRGISVKFSVAPDSCRCVNVGASLARQRRGVS
jgi:hypothetical protein